MAQKTRAQIATDIATAQSQIDTIISNTIQAITGDILNSVLDKLNLLADTLKDSSVLKSDDINNTLISSSTSTALSAAQGKVLKDLIDALSTVASTGDFTDLVNITAASTTASGVIELATSAEANALTDAVRAITPATIPIATETQKGITEQATQAEVNAGTSTNTYITPATYAASTQLSGKANSTHTHVYTEITNFNTGVSANPDVTASKAKTDYISITGAVNLDQVPEGNGTWETLVEGLLQRAAITPSALTTITHTAPGTPDYAVQALTNSSGFGFVTADEGHTVLSVIANLQARVNDLVLKLQQNGLIA